jgi:Zn-dependent protease
MSLQELILIGFYIIILMYSIIIHEVSHGIAALWQGDKTALYAGRITANPIRHIDFMWTIVIPIMMLMLSGGRFAFGGAKPVPFNPYNLRNQKWGSALVALGGPASNIIIALIFAIAARFIAIPIALKQDIIQHLGDWGTVSSVISGSVGAIFFTIFSIIVLWNVLLAFFNLIPIPPLDGSKLMFAVFKVKTETMIMLEQFGFIFLIIFIFAFSSVFGALLNFLWSLFFSITI